ncbi:Na(+)/H(+) exchange regulatory cofactor NHE-RF3 isoform X1 [Passer montanus]|uniref:Na(+)/H(+) exchange regulatory cofactor NHE-RF3 isoform X1 n=1 Tax=Passer montanus TaxID=9160 RepID=UPI00195F7EF4|nr:Na(+)/H(+) exchange regulatory cofactor NHE-RF3 isoform X1 [Passer montanus]XP_039569178.1 Na(+)/H(+) exchange regulatory cofactor NHE-RF3 isoform X1 [Passer montanus]
MTSALQPRECTVTKKPQKKYGFFLRIEQDTAGHIVRNVERDSPAQRAGLQDGDRVLRVNGVFVDKEEHAQVVEMVRNSGNSVVLLVLDDASYEKAQKEGVNLEGLGQKASTGQQQELQCLPSTATAAPQPRLCYLVKEETGYGFSLKSTEGQKGLFIVELSSQGAAAKAGVQNNDRLIEINGKNVENDTHEEVVEKVKKSENHVMFLLSNEETDRYFTSQRMALSKESASLRLLPLKPRLIEIQKGKSGYGFYLRMEQNTGDHVIKDVNSGSPAAMAGLKDNDILVAVNGERVDGLDHESVVGKIKQSEERTSLLVVDKETDSMYKLAQISPFSYYYKAQDSTPAKREERVELHTEQKVNHKPRICKMVKGPNGFGFSLNMIKNKPGLFITEVQSQGAADRAGVENNDFLVEVNGVNVTHESYDKVVARIQSTGDSLTLLVCSKDAYRQTHPPPPNQQPPQELTVTTVMTQSCDETKLCQEQQKRNLPNLFFSSSLLFHLSELGCSKEYQNHKGLQTLAAINTSV